MIQNKPQSKEQRSGKVAKKNKSLPQQSDQTGSASSKPSSQERAGGKASKSSLKQGKKKQAKLHKRTASSGSKKDNLHNPAEQEDLKAKQLSQLSEQA